MRTSNQVSMPCAETAGRTRTHDHRSHRERNEQCSHAPGEPGPRLPLPDLPKEAIQVVGDERGHRQQAGEVQDQQHRVETVETRGALCRIGHEPQRGEEESERREGQNAGLEPVHDDSTQLNQSSRRRHNERNQASGRSGEGMASISRRAAQAAR